MLVHLSLILHLIGVLPALYSTSLSLVLKYLMLSIKYVFICMIHVNLISNSSNAFFAISKAPLILVLLCTPLLPTTLLPIQMSIGLDARILAVPREDSVYFWVTTWFPGLLVVNLQSPAAALRLNIVQLPLSWRILVGYTIFCLSFIDHSTKLQSSTVTIFQRYTCLQTQFNIVVRSTLSWTFILLERRWLSVLSGFCMFLQAVSLQTYLQRVCRHPCFWSFDPVFTSATVCLHVQTAGAC